MTEGGEEVGNHDGPAERRSRNLLSLELLQEDREETVSCSKRLLSVL